MDNVQHPISGVNRLNEILGGTYCGHSPSALIADIIHFAEAEGKNFDDILRQGRVIAFRERDTIIKHLGSDVYAPLPQERRGEKRI